MLKVEFVGQAFAISAKRYALIDDNGIQKTSQHGLGYLLSPIEGGRKGWISRDAPDWIDRPALMPFTVSSWALYETFGAINEGRPYTKQVKPFNFVLLGSIPERWLRHRDSLLMTPYEPDPSKWNGLTWIDKHHPTGIYHAPVLRTFRDVIREYSIHPEYKFTDEHGRMCGPHTVGTLHRTHVAGMGSRVVGKEGADLESAQAGLFSADDYVPTLLGHPWSFWAPLVRPFLEECHDTGVISRRTYYRLIKGETTPANGGKALIKACASMALETSKASTYAE